MTDLTLQGPTGLPQVPPPLQVQPPVKADNGTLTPQAVPAAAPIQNDTSDRQKRAIAAVHDALAKSSGISLPPETKLVVIADKDSGRYVYEFQNPITGEIIVQYPYKEVLTALAAANVSARGAVISKRV